MHILHNPPPPPPPPLPYLEYSVTYVHLKVVQVEGIVLPLVGESHDDGGSGGRTVEPHLQASWAAGNTTLHCNEEL